MLDGAGADGEDDLLGLGLVEIEGHQRGLGLAHDLAAVRDVRGALGVRCGLGGGFAFLCRLGLGLAPLLGGQRGLRLLGLAALGGQRGLLFGAGLRRGGFLLGLDAGFGLLGGPAFGRLDPLGIGGFL